MSSILAFSLVALLLVISPGPNSVLIVKTASANGVLAGIRNALGLSIAIFIHGSLSVFGLSAILVHSAELFMIIKYLGAAYLFYIGAKAIYQSFKFQAKAANLPEKEATKPKGGFFLEGLLTQILNPKVSIFYLAAFPQFISFSEHYYVTAFLMVLIHASIVLSWFTLMTLAIQKLKSKASGDGRAGRWIQRASGAVMIYFSTLVVSHK